MGAGDGRGVSSKTNIGAGVVGEADGSFDGDVLGAFEGEGVGSMDGDRVCVGLEVGFAVGSMVGSDVGSRDGSAVGSALGSFVGSVVGPPVVGVPGDFEHETKDSQKADRYRLPSAEKLAIHSSLLFCSDAERGPL